MLFVGRLGADTPMQPGHAARLLLVLALTLFSACS